MWSPTLPLQLVFVLAPLLLVFTYASSQEDVLDYDDVNDIFFNRRSVPDGSLFGSGPGSGSTIPGNLILIELVIFICIFIIYVYITCQMAVR